MTYAEFKKRIHRIAVKNDDEFRIVMTKDESGFHLEVIEEADKHCFLSADGETEADCLTNAANEIPSALEHWSYEE